MANLTPTPGLDAVPAWDLVTPLQGGGPTAPLNRQAQALLNRTEYLRLGLQTAGADIDALEAKNDARDGMNSEHDAAWSLTPTELAQVQSNGAALDLSASLAAAKAAAGSRELKLTAGTWTISGYDIRGWYGTLSGNGIVATTVKQVGTNSPFFNASESSDVILSPFYLSKMRIEGLGAAANGIEINLRHSYHLSDLLIVGFAKGIVEKDTWLGRSYNVRIINCPIGWHFVGSNHNSRHYGASITGASTLGLKIESLGSALDGNDALVFDSLLVADGSGAGVDDAGSNVSYNEPYLGENLGGDVFTSRAGYKKIDGGVLFFGSTPSTYGFQMLGGVVNVRGLRINSQSSDAWSRLIRGTAGKITFEDCEFNFGQGGNQFIPGDTIGYGRAFTCYAPKSPRAYSNVTFNCTVSVSDAVPNMRTWTCTSVSAGAKVLVVYAPLVNLGDVVEGAAYVVVTYKSNADFSIRLSGGAGGTAPLKSIGTLPASAGVLQTYIKLDASIDNLAYTTLEIFNDTMSASPATSFSLVSTHLSDAAKMPLGNLRKC